MTQLPAGPSSATAVEDPNAASSLGGGVPQTSQGQQFLLEEEAAYAARGETFDVSGTLIPPQYAGDFWAFYQLAEQFAANTGWRYLLTPSQLIQGLQMGFGTGDSLAAFQWMSTITGAGGTQPWAGSGLSATDYDQRVRGISDALYQLTGSSDFTAAGIGGDSANMIIGQNWSQQQLQDWILKRPDLNGRYGYLKYGYTYSTFQQYKAQNAQALESRYGKGYTDAQAIANLGAPLPQFHASGGAFGQSTPFVQTQSNLPTGYAPSGR